MRRANLLACATVLVGFGGHGCSPSASSSASVTPPAAENAPAPLAPATAVSDAAPARREPAPAFVGFAIKSFNWEFQGYDVFQVDGSGNAVWMEASAHSERHKGGAVIVPSWHRVAWTLSADELAGLKAQLAESRFLDLESLYIDRNIEDGQNEELILRHERGEKRVTCSNQFPPEIQALREHVRKLVEPQRVKLRNAPALDRTAAEKIWLPI